MWLVWPASTTAGVTVVRALSSFHSIYCTCTCPCVTCLVRVSSEREDRDNLVQRCSVNSACKWSHRRNWKAAPSASLYLSLTVTWCHCCRAYGCLSIMCWCPVFSTPHRLGDGPWVASQGTVLLVHKGRLSQVFPGADAVPGGYALRSYQHRPYQNSPPQQALEQVLSSSQQQTPNDLLGEFLFGTLDTFSYRSWVKATTVLPDKPLILNVWFPCFFLNRLWDSPMYLLDRL